MQKICAIILLSALASNHEALPQTKWSRPIRNPQGELTRERRQFPFGEWIPLSQACPTCRQFADPLDVGPRGENIGLTPPRPPTVTRQIHGEGNFFPQDDASILSVPPPPPSAIPRHPVVNNNGNFQFSSFGQPFSNPLPVPTQKVFPQAQPIQFLPQSFLPNQPLLVNGNQPILPGLNTQGNLFGQEQNQQQINNGKVNGFNSEFKTQKIPENVVLEQNNRPLGPKQPFPNKPQPFSTPQHNQQQSFVQQQSFGGQQQHSVNFGSSILTPPPAPKNVTQDIVIPGLDKEEIQLLYVPVETLRQRGTPQEQLLSQQPQNVQFFNRGNSFKRPVHNIRPTEQTITPPKGHFVTQNGNVQGQTDSGLKVTSAQPFPSSVTPSTLLLQHLPYQQTPQPFVSATPATPTVDPFVTPASVFQKHPSFTPDSTLPHLSTVPNTVQFSQSDIDFGTTPKTLTTPGEIVNGKSQFGSGLKNTELNHDQIRTFQQPFVNQQQTVTQQPQLTTVFSQQQPKEVLTPTHFPHQIDQQQIALQQQQEHQRLLQQQRQNELEEKRILDQQRKQKELEEQRILQQKQQQHQKELEEQRIIQQQKQRQRELEEQRLLQQQQRQKELEQQRFLQKQKKLEEQRILQQQQRQKELEQQRFLQKQKELEEQRILQQQQRQKELEQQRFLQKQKELEEQRILQQQQRQKELEQQRFLQKQKELEEQRLLQQQRQKELEQQRYIQKQKELEEQRLLQRQKELEEQRILQRQKELEEQRLLQRQKELEEQRRLQLKQKEEERLARLQQQQKEIEQQRLLQQQQELQRQKQENLKKFQIFKQQHHQQQLLKQQQEQQLLLQQQQQQEQQLLQQQLEKEQPQQVFQQTNRHVLPANDNANFIPQLEKESELEEQQLVPHQPPLSVFFKGISGVEARITDVLRELRSSNTITVLDQYFEKMPKVFVGPAGLTAPAGYEKFELPYLSNLESNRIERRIGKLPFFVAPLNFVPPPGYAKIPFPAPHVGSVVVSSESNPAMTLKTVQKASAEEENVSGSFPVVGPELPGLINNLDTQTTTLKPTTYVSTPSLPQTTAQLRSRRPNNSIYKPQNRKPISRTRPTTTSKPEEEVTQPIQKLEPTKESEGAIRRPFNRFLNRRRQQAKTTTVSPLKIQQDGKSLENRQDSVETYQQEKNQIYRTQPKNDVIQENQNEGEQFNREFEYSSSIDRTTPEGHGGFEVRPTPDFSKGPITSEENQPEIPDYADVSLQTFEDGPLPTGSAKTITQELYRPNAASQTEGESNSKTLSKPESTPTSVKYPVSGSDDVANGKFSEISDPTPTAALGGYKETVSEEEVSLEPTAIVGFEKQDTASERFDSTVSSKTKLSFTPGPTTASREQQAKDYLESDVPDTSEFSEISRPQNIQGFVHPSQRPHQQFSDVYPTPEISLDLQAPEEQQSQEFDTSDEVKPTQNSAGVSNKFPPTASSNEQHFTGFEGVRKNQQSLHVSTSQVSPTASASTEEQYTTGVSANPQETIRQSNDERIGSFINVQDIHDTVGPQYFPSSTAFPPEASAVSGDRNKEFAVYVEENQPQLSSTPQNVEVTVNPSVETYTSASTQESLAHVNDRTQTSEGHGQDVANNLPNDHRLKLPNPSIVRVRTRVRGKQRGQVNFAASQSTTQAPFTRLGADSRYNENTEREITTKASNFRDYHPVKTSKFSQFRGVKKPVRTTTEAPVEEEQKTPGVYTIRPPRRPLNPSTVSTKRIRRPTTPLPSAEAATEAFEISTTGSRSQPEHPDISPSGVSNDVYYEQSSFSPVKHKFRKHFASAEQKNDVVPGYISTSFPTTAPTRPTPVHEEYSEETKELTRTQAPVEIPEKYPEWNPSDSGFDVSGIVLTTVSAPGHEEQADSEEPKKTQDNKKAFDPDLEKKTGRRRVRVRVHKRPHENFETAESQNLRTVANVLVPPTTTYKPNDESSFHELAKNVDFSFGGQKLFGSRSREYFRKRLNLTQHEGVKEGGQSEGANGDAPEKKTETKYFVRKAEREQKNDFESLSNQSSESGERIKTTRPKFRSFVRKVIKHGTVNKEAESEANQLPENEENGDKSGEYHPRQAVRGGFNHTGRVNGTRHKTFVRYVKKNKVRPHESEAVQEPQVEGQGLHQTTESHTTAPVHETPELRTTTELHHAKEEKSSESQSPIYNAQQQIEGVQSQQETDSLESQQEAESPEPQQQVERQESSQEPEPTEEPEIKQTQRAPTETTKETEFQEVQETSSQTFRESLSITAQPSTPQTQLGLNPTQRPKFYQTVRPAFHRPTAFQRSREPESTTAQSVQEPQEKRSGYSRFKYGKPTGFGTTSSERSDETKKVTEQQVKNKNLHALEVRKYLRTKNREGAFSQFSKNKYFTSEKTETVGTTTPQDQESVEQDSGEITTEKEVRTSSAEPKTTEAFVPQTDSAEVEDETTEHDDESDIPLSTTEAITLSKEVNSEEPITLPKEVYSEEHITLSKEVDSEEEITTPIKVETTTETEIPTTYFHHTTTTETHEKATEPKIQTTESVEPQRTEYEPDIYRFSKNSFSFDETEQFTGTKNRGHVRNITTDIIENTASFSAPGVEKRPDIRVVTHRSDEDFPTVTDAHFDITEKTEVGTTDFEKLETTTDYPETETAAAATDAVTKAKVAKILKTSTTTKVSHETEICYRGKCIRTKSENPDEDLKLLVDSANTVKTEKTKT